MDDDKEPSEDGGHGGRSEGGHSGGSGPDLLPEGCTADKSFATPLVRRLSHPELANTIKDVLGVDASAAVAKLPPPSVSGGLFSNHAAALDVSKQLAQGYEDLAREVAGKALQSQTFRQTFAPCTELAKTECTRGYISNLGKRMMRRPLSDEEVSSYEGVFLTAREHDLGFADAAAIVLEGFLQSPKFLYRVETERAEGVDGWRDIDGYELATRLSHLLWSSAPDLELLDAAAKGDLESSEGIVAQVDRMLADPRARRTMEDFGVDWMRLQSLAPIKLNAPEYAAFNEQMKADMLAESRTFFGDIFEDGAPWTEILRRKTTKASTGLAKLYGAEVAGGSGPIELTDLRGRRGILTHASVLSATAHGEVPQMVHRGLFILRNVFCSDVPPPSDAILQKIEEKKESLPPDATQREQAIDRMMDKDCGSCHKAFDPLAMVLEPFDSMGRFREKDNNGRELRTDFSLDLDSGPAAYENIDEYTEILAGREEVAACVAEKILQASIGRQVVRENEGCSMQMLSQALKDGGTFKDALATMAKSRRYRQLEVAAE